ncbi:hypothetical protein TBLA_0B04440 [Henningerozyma blattae CBS 6284]|uniref:Inner membrane assembly complex subunit 17 n=1 Tax=Henningerozyma blattae (strain ATCC 34711 / CBS 6284 / DSM 70876 / NBRC 10599 / NRRL Y-10934 / UCD 77-7) TaxID=1071380 RepID=I2GYS9_HENB6|nr:hypothetical protein TBLA_0B04440 [Tetrapisispora blattae CBS 6284]CCH59281.1 hypothetical protein TBLA_0B04440 [Tetrapisispora blattae CBS 6284]
MFSRTIYQFGAISKVCYPSSIKTSYLFALCTKRSIDLIKPRNILNYSTSNISKVSSVKNQIHYEKKYIDNDKVKTLEDLIKLETLDNVDPELIKKIINEKTDELNIQNELNLLKNLQKEEKQIMTDNSPLKKFIRPGWIFLLIASATYLYLHSMWWKYEYTSKESELKEKVEYLEKELNELIDEHKKRRLPKDGFLGYLKNPNSLYSFKFCTYKKIH